MSKRPLFITGIGTGVGKTIVAAILTESLKADYWKPVQSGDLDNSDTMKVQSLVSNKKTVFHPERYRLTQPYSPHKSADIDGVTINLSSFKLPQTDNTLIVEGAGGLMVPLNNKDLMVDLIKQLDAEVIMVVQHYLGSINHTLLSLSLLYSKNITIKAIIFNGDTDEYSENVIKAHTKGETIIRIPQLSVFDKSTIAAQKIVF
ncbi:dethiobiotin synthase [Mucilaginibacter auburnensis]|uniref:ATP-dependent dethiobiotin synthetase BioD n=1 Tax=Mucilaginibacter auburnensis TaxID=1457233 RepID=A0A2H9VL77_9SPHI|nr:dethiobiotin synthase [Mucilaginibacter auburnensis]PJJ79066.1 dethiobiotin synthetase [Mucilaginibacter auburnensis]